MSDQASFSMSDVYNPDGLISHDADDILSRGITLASGQANLLRGTVLGKITMGAASESHAGNTGNGVMTLDATTPILANAQAGAYVATCIAAATNSGTFEVKDPQGKSLGEYTVGATFADQLKFVIADGSADFIVGDKFTITIAAGSGKYVKSLLAAIDGSQYPWAILAEDTDATAGDVNTVAYINGNFHDDAVIFGTGQTIANTRELLRQQGINLVNRQPAT